MGARGEVVQSPVPWSELPAPAAWLLGYVRTDAPGYREVSIESSLFVVPPDEYRFDALIDEVGTFFGELVWSVNNKAGVTGIGAVGETYPDRLGWLIGANVEAGGVASSQDAARVIAPGAIPCIGYTWNAITVDEDRRKILDKHKRNQGYVWGAALLVQVTLVMHRWAFEALKTGWCLRGKVTVGGKTKLDDAFDGDDLQGAVTGYVLGVDSSEWIDATERTARVVMSLVREE